MPRLMAILTSVNGGIAGVDAILGGWLAGNFGFRSVFVVHGRRLPCSCGGARVRAARRRARPKARRRWTGPAVWSRSASRSWRPILAIDESSGARAAADLGIGGRAGGRRGRVLRGVLEHRVAQERRPDGVYPLSEAAPDVGPAAHHAAYHDWRVRYHEWRGAGDRARPCYGR